MYFCVPQHHLQEKPLSCLLHFSSNGTRKMGSVLKMGHFVMYVGQVKSYRKNAALI